MKYIIRYPKLSDWQELWRFINTLSQEKTYISYQGDRISQADEKKYVQQSLLSIAQHESVQLIVEHNHHVIGSASMNTKPRVQNHVGVIGISLLEPYRNQGIGKDLLQRLLQETTTQLPHIQIAELFVMDNNHGARHVYESAGFFECGRIPQGIRYRDKQVDEIIMIKNLNSAQ